MPRSASTVYFGQISGSKDMIRLDSIRQAATTYHLSELSGAKGSGRQGIIAQAVTTQVQELTAGNPMVLAAPSW